MHDLKRLVKGAEVVLGMRGCIKQEAVDCAAFVRAIADPTPAIYGVVNSCDLICSLLDRNLAYAKCLPAWLDEDPKKTEEGVLILLEAAKQVAEAAKFFRTRMEIEETPAK